MSWLSFSHDELEARDRYKLLSGAIVPRPIALITTMLWEDRLGSMGPEEQERRARRPGRALEEPGAPADS
mgnify:CR=1 FL=1